MPEPIERIVSAYNEQQLKELAGNMQALAKVFREYFVALRQEGFTEEQAFELVKDWQHKVIASGKGEANG